MGPQLNWRLIPPDLAVGRGGEVLVTSNVLPILLRIDLKTFRVTVHHLDLDQDNDKDVGFTKISYSADQDAYFAVSELHNSTWRIDRLLRAARKVAIADTNGPPCARPEEDRWNSRGNGPIAVHVP